MVPYELVLSHIQYLLIGLKGPKLRKTQNQVSRAHRKNLLYLAEKKESLPSKASFNGVMNRWNSISSMAASTSVALSVLRFPFMAKLLALKKKLRNIRGCQNPTFCVWSRKRITQIYNGRVYVLDAWVFVTHCRNWLRIVKLPPLV